MATLPADSGIGAYKAIVTAERGGTTAIRSEILDIRSINTESSSSGSSSHTSSSDCSQFTRCITLEPKSITTTVGGDLTQFTIFNDGNIYVTVDISVHPDLQSYVFPQIHGEIVGKAEIAPFKSINVTLSVQNANELSKMINGTILVAPLDDSYEGGAKELSFTLIPLESQESEITITTLAIANELTEGNLKQAAKLTVNSLKRPFGRIPFPENFAFFQALFDALLSKFFLLAIIIYLSTQRAIDYSKEKKHRFLGQASMISLAVMASLLLLLVIGDALIYIS